jgi:hypothetical protein
MDERFWARMILIVHRMVGNTAEVSEQLRQPLENLFGACYKELPARQGAENDARYNLSTQLPASDLL